MQEYQNDDIIVSVCLTAYNHGKYIAQALDSILMQEVGFKYEIVVGEDCSPDNTREILLDYKAKYPDKLKLLLHEKNMGGKKNVMTTLKNCSGKYIAMLDGDDYWIDPKKLQIQIDLMESYPDCHMSFHPAEARIDNAETGKVIAKHANKNKIFSTSEVILGGGGFTPTASTIFHREVIDNLPDFFVGTTVGDYYMQVLGSLNGGALYIDRVMSVYRQGVEGSWSTSLKNIDIDRKVKWHHDSIKSLNELNKYLDFNYQKEFDQRISNHYYRMSILYLKNDLYKEFRKNIELSYNLHAFKSFKFFILYYLRLFPKFIKYLYQFIYTK